MFKFISQPNYKIEIEDEDKEVLDDKYLANFIKMHEYKLQSKIYQAQAERLSRKIERRHLPINS